MVPDFGFIVDEVDAAGAFPEVETHDEENSQFLMALSTPKPILSIDDSTVPNRPFGRFLLYSAYNTFLSS
jgi:hypothetical protein